VTDSGGAEVVKAQAVTGVHYNLSQEKGYHEAVCNKLTVSEQKTGTRDDNGLSEGTAELVHMMHDYGLKPSEGVEESAGGDQNKEAQEGSGGEDNYRNQWTMLWEENYTEVYWHYYNLFLKWNGPDAGVADAEQVNTQNEQMDSHEQSEPKSLTDPYSSAPTSDSNWPVDDNDDVVDSGDDADDEQPVDGSSKKRKGRRSRHTSQCENTAGEIMILITFCMPSHQHFLCTILCREGHENVYSSYSCENVYNFEQPPPPPKCQEIQMKTIST
jgi:hypothetical protein